WLFQCSVSVWEVVFFNISRRSSRRAKRQKALLHVSLFKKKNKKIDTGEATRVIRRMMSENIREYKKNYVIAILASLIVGASNGALAYLMKPMIDKIFYEQNLGLVWVICGTLLAIFILRGISGYIQAVELAKI